MGEVADADVVAKAEGAVVGDLVHDGTEEGGFSLAVAADEGYFFAAEDLEVDVAEDDAGAVGEGEVAGGEDDVAGAGGGLEADGDVGGVLGFDFDALEALELLDAGLYLGGLGGLVAEAFDELLGVLDLFLLVFVGAGLLFDALAAELGVAGVGDVVVVDFAEGDFEGAGGTALPSLCTLSPPPFVPPAPRRDREAGKKGGGWLGDLTSIFFALGDSDDDSDTEEGGASHTQLLAFSEVGFALPVVNMYIIYFCQFNVIKRYLFVWDLGVCPCSHG